MSTALRKLRIFICLCLSFGIILSSITIPSFASSTNGNQSTSPLLSVNDRKDINKKLYTFESDNGTVLNIVEMENDVGATSFIINCSYLICSNGSVYSLSGIKPEIVKKFKYF